MTRYALTVVDMVKDNVDIKGRNPMDIEATKIIPSIVKIAEVFRQTGNRVIFACDSFMEGDFIFGGRMKPHAIRGTGGDHAAHRRR